MTALAGRSLHRTPEEAFAHLAEQSHHANRELREIVERAGRG
ncbi:hypothetical protein [Kineococcus sp. SYSU DK005]